MKQEELSKAWVHPGGFANNPGSGASEEYNKMGRSCAKLVFQSCWPGLAGEASREPGLMSRSTTLGEVEEARMGKSLWNSRSQNLRGMGMRWDCRDQELEN